MGHDILKSDGAASDIVGILLIIGICITSINFMIIYAVPVLDDMNDNAKAQKIEQGFTVFDSRTSKVALGESPTQTTHMSLMGGSIDINGDNSAYNNSNMHIEIFRNDALVDEFDCPMGTIEYRLEDRIVAYEGGGVWSKYPTGGAVMISPPEFHYNGETLTLPVMKIEGRSSVSGKTDAGITIRSSNMPVLLYPDMTNNSTRTNPLDCDYIKIYIKSDYYDAWADYAGTLIETSGTPYDSNKTAVIKLNTIPDMGTLPLTNSILMGSVNQSNLEPMYNFSFNMQAAQSSGLNNLKHTIQATSGNRTLIYYFQKKMGADKVHVEVEYMDTAAGEQYVEYWVGEDQFPIDGNNEDEYSTVDLLNKTNIIYYNPVSAECANTDYSWGPESSISTPPNVTISGGYATSLYNITHHYMRLITEDGSVRFIGNGGAQDKLDYDSSTYSLTYDNGEGITYLHVTRNELSATTGN